jgi:ubiquinone/menaquinone biosynthesis C-methylase UbiE
VFSEMGLWSRIFAAGYDRLMAGTEKAGLQDRRRELLERASGRVIEIGAGTGANLAFYGPEVTELVLTEPEEPMARRLERKAAGAGLRASIVRAPAERLPFPDDSFDSAISTLVLCTVPDQSRALAEIRRVLRPGGQLLFLEHVRSEDPSVAKWQDRITPLWRRVGNGCHPNRTTAEAIRSSFAAVEVEHGSIPKAPPVFRPLRTGRATAP